MYQVDTPFGRTYHASLEAVWTWIYRERDCMARIMHVESGQVTTWDVTQPEVM